MEKVTAVATENTGNSTNDIKRLETGAEPNYLGKYTKIKQIRTKKCQRGTHRI